MTYEELLRRNGELEEENKRLRARVAELEEQVGELKGLVVELEEKLREGLRQAAPFRVRPKQKKEPPGRPGRKEGHVGERRAIPDHIDERVEVPLEHCPKCGGQVEDVKPVEQYIEDLPEVRPHVTQLITYTGRCRRCGCVRSTHPLQTSVATGAAGVHLGARALGLAADLNKRLGLTCRKTCEVLRAHFGLTVSAGGLVHALRRVSDRLQGVYEGLRDGVRASPAVYTDETGWWVGGPGFWLWVFTTPRYTCYVVDDSRGHEVIDRMLGDPYGGTLVSDCLSSYDVIACRKQKCYAHHLKAIAEAREHAPDSQFLRDMQLLLKTACKLGSTESGLSMEQKQGLVWRFERAADTLLSSVCADPWEQWIANRLCKQREHLFTFLSTPGVEATNNRAERQLRHAVIARKLSCGNKTMAGKRCWEILTSVAVTCQQNGLHFASFVSQAMSLNSPAPQLLSV